MDEKPVVFSGWQGSSDGSMRANNIYAKTTTSPQKIYINRKMEIGLKSLVVLVGDDLGNMMKWVMDHSEGTLAVKSTSLKKNKSQKKSPGTLLTSSACFYFVSTCPNFSSSIDHNCPVECAGCERPGGLPENSSANMDANSCGKGWWPTCFPTVTCPSSAKVSTKHCCAIFSVIVLTSNLRFLDVDACAFENLIVCVFRGPLLSSGDAVTGAKNGRCESNTMAIDTLPENQHAPKLAPRQRTKYHHVLHGDCGLLLETQLVARCQPCMVSTLQWSP